MLPPKAPRDGLMLLVIGLLIALVMRPFPNVPFADDWAYSWSVNHLLATGRFRFPELVLNPIPTHVLWGALFSLPGGYSLATLRVSTWVLGMLAVWSLYLLVREMGGDRTSAGVAAALLGFYPVFFILAPTFMTDVPFLALMTLSSYLFVRALNRRRVSLVWLAAAVCAASVGVRVIGVGVAGAMIATLLFHTGRWGRRPVVLIPPALVPPLAVALFAWTRARVFAPADITWVAMSPARRVENLRYAWDLLPQMLVGSALFVVVLTGWALLPLAAGLIRRRFVARAGVAFVLLSAAWVAARAAAVPSAIPLESGSIWALRELGATATLLPGWQPQPLPTWIAVLTVGAALASAAVLYAAWPRTPLRDADAFLAWTIAAHFLLIATLWLTYDRYALVFIPPAIALVLGRSLRPRLLPVVAGSALFAVVSLAGMHDHLAFTRAIWSAVADLRAQGIRPAEIDGGYVVNGWQQYLHPEDAYRDENGRILIPMVNDALDLTYTVASRRIDAREVVRTYPYAGWLRPDGEIYVLKRNP